MRGAIAVLALCAGLAACGNADVMSPIEVTQNYAFDLGEGNYPGACALLDQPERRRLASFGPRLGCAGLLARCLPKGSTILRHDQAQLLYANVLLDEHGSSASARLSGTAVADAAREVTLVNRQSGWRLSSPGRVITRCMSRLSHRSRRGRRGPSARG